MSLALVLGAADCLWSDLDTVGTMLEPATCLIVACNDAGVLWPGHLDAWATMHPEELPGRVEKRHANGYAPALSTWTRPYPYGMEERERLCDHVLGGWDKPSGSSGYFALGVALDGLGATHAILCGIPMDARKHMVRERHWTTATKYREPWERNTRIKRLVRSPSGWTRDLLGPVTLAWLTPYMQDSRRSDTTVCGIDRTQSPHAD